MSKDDKKDDGLVTGIILITIGIIALLVTFFDMKIVWEEVAKFWPVFIIIFGVSILPLNKVLKSVGVILLILISCLLYYNNVNDIVESPSSFSYDITDDDVDIQKFSESYRKSIETAEVQIDYGAGILFMSSPVESLVEATNASNYIMQDMSVRYDGNHAEIDFNGENNVDININGKEVKSNKFNVALNENPIYDFELNLGACNLDFDLSEYKVSRIEVNSGASDIDIRLGDLYGTTSVDLETGVSDIRIGIPSASGCRVQCESLLSNKDFKGFIKKSGSVYETSNYLSAENHVNIKIEGAISDLEVYRY